MEKFTWVLLVSLVAQTCGYRILVIFPMPAKSHGILGEGMVRHLANAGHQVTYIASVPIKPYKNLVRQIDVSSNFDLMPETIFQDIVKQKISLELFIRHLHLPIAVANSTLNNKDVLSFFSDTSQKFDVVIAEWMFSELYLGVPLLYDCPYIWVSSTDPHWLITSLIDEATNPALVPEILSPVTPPFTFWERTKQFFNQCIGAFLKYTYLTMLESTEYERIYGPLVRMRGKTLPPYQEVKYNTSLILGNSHVSVGEAMSVPQNFKRVGGYHIENEVKPLPDDLKKLMDNAKNGVIYFSLGSNVKSKNLEDSTKKGLLKIFGELKQTVIWKFEDTSLSDLPPNVHIMSWTPQQSILAHPNCILFITHGGLLSTFETIHYGKPIIGLPAFADQHMNIYRAVKKGYGLSVRLLSPTIVEELRVTINEVLGNPKYAERAKELSAIYHDRPIKPGQELVHWVEHVIRTRGAPHLRSPALHVPFYQKMYLDLAAVILIIALVLNKIINRLCCSKKKIDQKKKRN